MSIFFDENCIDCESRYCIEEIVTVGNYGEYGSSIDKDRNKAYFKCKGVAEFKDGKYGKDIYIFSTNECSKNQSANDSYGKKLKIKIDDLCEIVEKLKATERDTDTVQVTLYDRCFADIDNKMEFLPKDIVFECENKEIGTISEVLESPHSED